MYLTYVNFAAFFTVFTYFFLKKFFFSFKNCEDDGLLSIKSQPYGHPVILFGSINKGKWRDSTMFLVRPLLGCRTANRMRNGNSGG